VIRKEIGEVKLVEGREGKGRGKKSEMGRGEKRKRPGIGEVRC